MNMNDGANVIMPVNEKTAEQTLDLAMMVKGRPFSQLARGSKWTALISNLSQLKRTAQVGGKDLSPGGVISVVSDLLS
jgi:hypothetical protein